MPITGSTGTRLGLTVRKVIHNLTFLVNYNKMNLPTLFPSFDPNNFFMFPFLLQVHYPSDPQQPGPIYFKTPRKCALFGVCCDAFPTQVNYLCDEACSSSKGANTVISYLHHYFANYGLGERKLVLHADNCWQVLYYFDMVMLLCALVNFSVTVAETILTALYDSESRSHPRFRKPLVAIMFCSGQNKNNCMMQYLASVGWAAR